MTPEQRAELRRLHVCATDPPWRPCKRERTDRAALLKDLTESWLLPEGHEECDPDFFGIMSGDGESERMPCLTGNGPTSEANARLVSNMRNHLIALLDALGAAERERDEARAVLEEAPHVEVAVVGIGDDSESRYGCAWCREETLGLLEHAPDCRWLRAMGKGAP